MQPDLIGVTGSTGQVGGMVARALAARGVQQRLVVRDLSRAPALAGAQARTASYRDGAAAREALSGVHTLFMVSAAEAADRVTEHLTFLDAAAAAGVQRVVYLSIVSASPTATFTLARDHWATEERLRELGLAFTILRDNLYADFLPNLLSPDGTIRGPAGEGRLAAVAQADVADVATAVLSGGESYDGRTIDLTGPVALTLAEAADLLSQHLRRPVRYVPETVAEAYASRAGYGAERWQLDAWVSTYTAIAAGDFAEVSDDVGEVLGRPATTLAEVLARRTSG